MVTRLSRPPSDPGAYLSMCTQLLGSSLRSGGTMLKEQMWENESLDRVFEGMRNDERVDAEG